MTIASVTASPAIAALVRYFLHMDQLCSTLHQVYSPTPEQKAEFERLVAKPHVVRSDHTIGQPSDMKRWCRENGIWCRIILPDFEMYPLVFQFGRAEDEILFRLRWGGQSK